MRSIRIALSCLASALALIALSAGAALAGDPHDDGTITLAGITLGSDDESLDVDLDADLDLQLGVGSNATTAGDDVDIDADAGLDVELGHPAEADTSAPDAHVDATVGVHVGGTDVGNTPVVDADADIEASAIVGVGGRSHEGVAALVRVPALLDVAVLDAVEVGALGDACIAVGLFADAPACRLPVGTDAPAGADNKGLAAIVDTAAAAATEAGEDVAANGVADACIGVGIGTAAPTCGAAAVTPGDGSPGTPTEPAPDRPGDGGVAPDEAVAEPDPGAVPATASRSADASAPAGELPDTALGGPTDIGLWMLVAALLAGLALGHLRARSSAR
jgi:hypothetical protein